MSEIIHARRTPEGIRYRVWGTIVDAYLTDTMDKTELRAHLLDNFSPRDVRDGVAAKQIDERVERANTHGTSTMRPGPCKLDAPWETARCNGCGGFHHAYKPRLDGTCRGCGEGADYRSHQPACVVVEDESEAL